MLLWNHETAQFDPVYFDDQECIHGYQTLDFDLLMKHAYRSIEHPTYIQKEYDIVGKLEPDAMTRV